MTEMPLTEVVILAVQLFTGHLMLNLLHFTRNDQVSLLIQESI